MVTRYEFLLCTVGSTTPLIAVNLGKPAPDSAGTIRIALSVQLLGQSLGAMDGIDCRIEHLLGNGACRLRLVCHIIDVVDGDNEWRERCG